MNAQTYATDIVKILANAGYTAYFAGGWVRDFMMGHPSSDIDIATDARPEKILDLFPHTNLVGLAFGVVIVVKEGHQFEVATFREDIEYIHGRRPEKIAFATAKEDAQRRDFTINGMFYDPLEDKTFDYVRGVEDIQKGIIRAIGNPHERFVEDRLRMIRAVRFAARFKFVIDEQTEMAIRENADTLFPAVAMERVWQEFKKMSEYPHFDIAIVNLHRLGLLSVIFPSLAQTHLNEIKQRVIPFPHFPKQCPTIIYLLEIFPDMSLEGVREICEYLKVSNQMLKVAELYWKAKKLVSGGGSDVDWVYFYVEKDSQICFEAISARHSEEEKKAFFNEHYKKRIALTEHIRRVQERKPLITAATLQQEGIAPGPLMGQLLKEAERITILHDINDLQVALNKLKDSSLWPEGDLK